MKLVSTVEKAQDHFREKGKFIVIIQCNVRVFHTLIEAFKYYYCMEGEASLWDITEKDELLERKCFKLQ